MRDNERGIRLVLPDTLYARVQAQAGIERISASEWMRRAIEKALNDAPIDEPGLPGLIADWREIDSNGKRELETIAALLRLVPGYGQSATKKDLEDVYKANMTAHENYEARK